MTNDPKYEQILTGAREVLSDEEYAMVVADLAELQDRQRREIEAINERIASINQLEQELEQELAVTEQQLAELRQPEHESM